MNKILAELGYSCGLRAKTYLVGLFAATTLFFLVAGQLIVSALNISPVIFHALVWGGWFSWQGRFFARRRERYLRENPRNAYRTAFRHDVVPGVALGVSQMLRPPWQAVLISLHFTDALWLLLGSAALIATGAGLLYTGFRTIGFDGAGFLYEYRTNSAPLKQRSIYAFIRHPLFLGGVLASAGAGLLCGGVITIAMAAINVLVLPIYSHLEDVRLTRVFGRSYGEYRMQVGGLIPRRGILQRAASKREGLG